MTELVYSRPSDDEPTPARERLTSPRVIARKDPTYTGRGRAMLWSLETQGTEQKE